MSSMASFLLGLFIGGTFGLVLFSLINIARLSDETLKNMDKGVDYENDKE